MSSTRLNTNLKLSIKENVKVYHLHIYNRKIQQNSLCAEPCVPKEFPISPRFSVAFFHRDAI